MPNPRQPGREGAVVREGDGASLSCLGKGNRDSSPSRWPLELFPFPGDAKINYIL